MRNIDDEILLNIFNEKREIINRIKDGLLSSECINTMIYYDNNQLICGEDPTGKKLESINDIANDIIDYFNYIKNLNIKEEPTIWIREIFLEDYLIIEFAFPGSKFNLFRRNTYFDTGIIFTDTPGVTGTVDYKKHIEDNWYIYHYTYE